jgi:Skp family chaperone for outer membrane proteins
MKKFSLILIASILLLSASVQANTAVGYNNESNVKSGVTVAWFGEKTINHLKGSNKRYNAKKQKKKDDKKAKELAEKNKKKKKKARKKKEKAFTDGELRVRAEREYAHRHSPSKYR